MSDTATTPSRYAIIRFHKYKSGSAIQKVKDHNIRAEGKQPDGVDPSKSHLNLIEGAQTNEEFDEAMKARMATLTRKPRPDANRLCQAVVTGSPAVFDGLTREQSIELLRHGVEFVSAKLDGKTSSGCLFTLTKRRHTLTLTLCPWLHGNGRRSTSRTWLPLWTPSGCWVARWRVGTMVDGLRGNAQVEGLRR